MAKAKNRLFGSTLRQHEPYEKHERVACVGCIYWGGLLALGDGCKYALKTGKVRSCSMKECYLNKICYREKDE